jgi:hypothetical protein
MDLFKQILFCVADPSLKGYNSENSFEDNSKSLEAYISSKNHYKHGRLTIAFSCVNNVNPTTHSKFQILGSCMDNKFVIDNHIDDYLAIFCEAQRLYHSLSKFAFLYKYKRSKVQNEEDMMMTPIHIGDKNAISIYENNSRYLFRISEILNIVKTSLCNYVDGLEYIEPKPIKNPYTNIPFNKSSLYKMYFECAKNTVKIPELFRYYFLCNFSLSTLYTEYNPFLAKMAIKDFIKNSPINILYSKSIEMLSDVEEFAEVNFKFTISPKFDKTLLVEVMKPYLELYLITVHSMDNFYSNSCLEELKYKLKLLHTNNPTFGRKLSRTVSCFNDETRKIHTFSSEYTPYQHGNMTDNYGECHSYSGFVDDVEYRLDDEIFAIARANRIRRDRTHGFIQQNSENNVSIMPSSHFRSLVESYRSYNFVDSDAEERVGDDDDTLTVSSVDSIDQNIDNHTVVDEEEEDQEDQEEEENFTTNFDDSMSINDGGELTISCLQTDDSCQEDGEIIEDITKEKIDDLTVLTTQIRELVDDGNILILDGTDRLTSLLTQIDNLDTNK